VILCGGFQKIHTTKKRFFVDSQPTLNTLQKVFKGVGGSVFIHQLKAVKPRAVRVYMAARSRVARRVASTVWPCRSKVKSGRLQKSCNDYGQTGPGGSMENLPAYE